MPQLQVLLAVFLSATVNTRFVDMNSKDALPIFMQVSVWADNLRFGLMCSRTTTHPLVLILPVPEATTLGHAVN